MRILFILKQVDNDHLGILHLSSVLKSGGHEVELIIGAAQDPTEVAARWRPDIVAYSVFTGSQHYYLDLNRRIRARQKVFSVFGGPHPTFFPELIQEDGVDGICIGEGEGAFLELANALQSGQPVTGIANWWIKENGVIHENAPGHLVEDLDSLPFPDRALLYERYAPSRYNPLKPFITGRGCPYNCTYCFNHSFAKLYRGKGRMVRQRSVDNVLAEMSWVLEAYPFQLALFMDDTFIVSREWVAEFAEKYPRVIGKPFWCQVRANLVNDGIVRLLKQAGCVSVSMGVEAGNDDLRNRVLNRNMSKETIIRACQLLGAQGIAVMTTNMLGLPGGSLAADLETLELNRACKPAYASALLFQPYPRTALGEYAQREHLMEGTFDDISFSATAHSVLRFSDAREKRQIENLQKLFAVGVEWPFLLPLIRLLLKLPSNRLYWLIYKLWKGYALKNRLHPHRLSTREFLRSLTHFLQIDAD
ncbi:MAG: radical SAM protein [Chloroflexota bacterium]